MTNVGDHRIVLCGIHILNVLMNSSEVQLSDLYGVSKGSRRLSLKPGMYICIFLKNFHIKYKKKNCTKSLPLFSLFNTSHIMNKK